MSYNRDFKSYLKGMSVTGIRLFAENTTTQSTNQKKMAHIHVPPWHCDILPNKTLCILGKYSIEMFDHSIAHFTLHRNNGPLKFLH